MRVVQELIINILGKDSIDTIGSIATCINDNGCNILDSRHAIYGQDFSLTMIVSGKSHLIARLEVAMSTLCMSQDLLCLMKRTEGHVKQNLEQLITVKFKGVDSKGILQRITQAISSYNVNISALRQKTTQGEVENCIECKMILSAPTDLNLVEFDNTLKHTLNDIALSGQISHQLSKEDNEYIESW
ncbi:MAG: ACT domain-containing protein [Pseudomonadota bacterium]